MMDIAFVVCYYCCFIVSVHSLNEGFASIKGTSSYQNSGNFAKAIVGGLTSLTNILNTRDETKQEGVLLSSFSPREVYDGVRLDFEAGYLFSGRINSSLYDPACVFTDPTISFQGLSTFQRNINSLQPILKLFLSDNAVILYDLQLIESERKIIAQWRMLGNLKLLPWTPQINVKGQTTYTLDENKGNRIIDYSEVWATPPGKALLQILTPTNQSPFKNMLKNNFPDSFDQEQMINESLERSINQPQTVSVNVPDIITGLKKLLIDPTDSSRTEELVVRLVNKLKIVGRGNIQLEELKGTNWKLMYTNAKGIENGHLGPFKATVMQSFASEGNGFFENILEFGILQVALAAQCSYKAADNEMNADTKLNIQFKESKISLAGIDLTRNQDKGRGYWKMVYCDRDLRIFFTNKESLFIFQRM